MQGALDEINSVFPRFIASLKEANWKPEESCLLTGTPSIIAVIGESASDKKKD
jgi:hypothetical protein